MADQALKLLNPLLIDPGAVSLRGPELESDQFRGLKRSIEAVGILENIIVYSDPNQKGKYCLIDGLQRLTIAKELGLETIPCQVRSEVTPMQVLSLQLQANFHRVDTKPAAYGRQIRRFLMEDASLTVNDIANDLGVSAAWVTQRINLHTLTPEIADKVDNGDIKASKAFWLAKLPANEQATWVTDAIK